MFVAILLFVIFGEFILSSELYPPALVCVLAYYGGRWLYRHAPDLRRHRGPADDKPTAEPTSKAELKAWLFRNTHHRLPAEEQPFEFYRDLYERSRLPPPAVPMAAKKKAAPAGRTRFVAATGQGFAALPRVDWAISVAMVVAAFSVGGLLSTTSLPEPLRQLGRLHDALDLSVWLRAVGCALGVWSVASASPLSGPLGDTVLYATAAAIMFHVAGGTLLYGALLPVLTRLLPPSSFFYFYRLLLVPPT
eukprot:6854756-Prymnesium_polylepis.1